MKTTLLQTSTFSHLPAGLMWQLALLVSIILAIMSVGILVRMRVNKLKEQRRHQIRKQWNDLLAGLLLEENLPEEGFVLPGEFQKALQKPFVRRVVASELVRTRASLRGQMGEMVTLVYNQLKLYDDSIRLLQARQWHRKAKGIQQLSIMEQYRVADLIVQYTNHRNVSVRSEAQVGMVRLEGPNGLRFLNYLRQPLSEWQQFNLLHELQLHTATNLPDLAQWLASEAPSVAVFAIRLCRLFQLFDYAAEIGVLQRHTHAEVRVEANQCLHHWGLSELGVDPIPYLAPVQEPERITA